MSRTLPAVLAAGLALFGDKALWARSAITPPAPEFPKGAAWLNSEPFTLERLRGRRVMLVSFINTNALASLRTFRQLNLLWDGLALEGLMIVGVLTPDYESDKDPIMVRKALARFDIRFPVVIDSSRALWRGYSNEGWPAHFLVDQEGKVVFERVGEGEAQELEREVLQALRDFNGFRPEGETPPAAEPETPCGKATRPVYIGGRRAAKVPSLDPRLVPAIGESQDGQVSSMGSWTLEPDALRAAKPGEDLDTGLRLVYRGAEALAVLNRPKAGKPLPVFVKQDGLWLNERNAHQDIRWDKLKRSFVLIDEPRLYYLAKNAKDDMHELFLYPSGAGAGISAFEFSDACRTRYEHR
ncbi:MAG: hypothetical protein AAB412_05655 [Elusimicrobiota bacterium]